jgi:hypothetical protein
MVENSFRFPSSVSERNRQSMSGAIKSGLVRAILLLTVLLPALAGAARGQDTAPIHSLRIFPAGDPPPYLQEVRDGVRYEIPPEEGTIPPRNIIVTIPGSQGTAPQELPLRLRLGSPSTAVELPLPPGSRAAATTATGDPWLAIPLANTSSSIAFVWRNAGKSWFEPRVLTLPDDPAAGGFRFVNLAPVPVALTWGTEKIRLNPAASVIRRIPAGTRSLPVTLEYPMPDGSLRLCFSSQVEPSENLRHWFVAYAADGVKPRQPVKVKSYSEELPAGSSAP